MDVFSLENKRGRIHSYSIALQTITSADATFTKRDWLKKYWVQDVDE